MLANKKRQKNGNSNRNKNANGNQANGNKANGNVDENRQPNHYNRDSKPHHNRGNRPHPNKRFKDNGNQDKPNNKARQVDEYEKGYVPQVEEGKIYDGIVQNYYREKGYGFIRCEEFKVPAFFHYSEIQLDGFKYLIKQQKVEFKARVSDDGKLQAYEVTPTELAPTQKRQIFNKEG
ncbi:MAG: cold shock domain-containing protein [Gammaproteobacteria bacterium]|nr:cold shock domain-containing protein [Gammaproteobacteria bacterium]